MDHVKGSAGSKKPSDLCERQGQQCPQLVIPGGDGDAVIDTINEEMKARFMAFIPRSADGAARDDVTVHTFVSLTDTVISVLLKQEFEMVYGTDGAAWSICYDYRDKMIVPCGAYLSSQGYFYSEICEKIWKLLLETSTYEKVNIPCFYFDSNSNLILVVEALEHPSGADPWNRIYYYSVSEDSFVSSPIGSEQDSYIEHPVVDPTDIASLPTKIIFTPGSVPFHKGKFFGFLFIPICAGYRPSTVITNPSTLWHF